MSKATRHLRRSIPIGLLLLLSAAAVAGSGLPPCPLGLIEGPDPIGRCVTEPGPNPDQGETRDIPELGNNPEDGAPFLVWAEGRRGLRDIAFTSWTEQGWGPTEYIATTLSDEADPRAFVTEDGTILVAWWAAGRAGYGVFYAAREPQYGDWSPPVRVTANGHHPSIAVVGGQIMVAFERDHPVGMLDLMVAVEHPNGTWTEQLVRSMGGFGTIRSRLHHQRGLTWIDWAAAPGQLAWSEWNGTLWSQPGEVVVESPTWQAEQDARDVIREIVFDN